VAYKKNENQRTRPSAFKRSGFIGQGGTRGLQGGESRVKRRRGDGGGEQRVVFPIGALQRYFLKQNRP